jgi:hypothetical protein
MFYPTYVESSNEKIGTITFDCVTTGVWAHVCDNNCFVLLIYSTKGCYVLDMRRGAGATKDLTPAKEKKKRLSILNIA